MTGTKRLANRIATGDDAGQIAAIYAPIVERSAISFEIDPPTPDEMRRRIDSTLPLYPWLVCSDGSLVAGYAYAGQHRVRAAYQWSVDVSVYIREDFRRRGVGRALYTSLIDLLVAQGFYQAYAGITLPNAASVGLHEALGFRPLCTYRNVGFKLGSWHDVGWWELGLRSADCAPRPPWSFGDLRAGAELARALGRGADLLEG